MSGSTATTTRARRFSRGAGLLALLALTALVAAGPGYRLNFIELGLAFQLTITAAGLALLALIVGLTAIILGRRTRPRAWGAGAVAGVVFGLLIAVQLGSWYKKARSVPAIHDITTDTKDPPEFDVIAPLRASAPNPAAYDGAAVAEQQLSAYPDIKSLTLDLDVGAATIAAANAAENLGWEIVAIDPVSGHLEAIDTTFWYGYKDDVVVRIRKTGDRSVLDVRSKSRVGVSDLGTNAARIRKFTRGVSAQLDP